VRNRFCVILLLLSKAIVSRVIVSIAKARLKDTYDPPLMKLTVHTNVSKGGAKKGGAK
jgi:hypothetical protein